ncbi:Flp family type IVb pilin [Vibrio breoganii]|uniref:Flp family type IVb pilin n=1 Tax=Vibrio breoganii TaxID=553239 RepID=UPI000C834B38|nr:hypothetical protein [Vibrio breoganii]PMG94445.1 hypothetical protein BCU81_17445 [Vibrio breoganii]
MDVKKNILSFFKDEEGLTVVEYVLGAALLVVAIASVFSALEGGLTDSLSDTLKFVSDNAATKAP